MEMQGLTDKEARERGGNKISSSTYAFLATFREIRLIHDAGLLW